MPVWSLEELQVVYPERTKEDIEYLYLVCGGIPHYVIQDLKENPTQDIEAAVAKEQMAIQSVVGNLTLGAIKAMAIQLENCTIPDNSRHRLLRFPSMKMKMGNLTTKNRMFTSPLSLSRRKSSSQNKVKLNCLSFIEQTSLSSGFVGQWFAS